MATPMLQARAALRIIDRMDKLTKERLLTSVQQNEAAPLAGSEPAAFESRRLDRPPSHTAVDIPELATLDSAQAVQEYPNKAQPARQQSTEVAPSVMPPTFSGGAGLHSGLGNSNKHSNSSTMPVSESYMERQSSQAFGPIAAKRRSQSLIKMDRSGRGLRSAGSGVGGVSGRSNSSGLPATPTSPGPTMSPSEKWRQAAGDINIARKHLKRDSPNGSPPQDADDLFKLLKRTADKMGGGGNGETTRKSRRPGWIPGRTDAKALWTLVTSSWLNLLILVVPVGWAVHFAGLNSILVFCLNIVGLVPLALILGEITEDLAVRFGPTVGGLLNATFGNVVELILSIVALTKGLYTVVAASLIGSILSNLLLVLGCCFLIGGFKFKSQMFSATINKASCSLLFLACIAIVIPTAAPLLYPASTLSDKAVYNISHSTAIILVLVYVAYLFFQLKTHKAMFNPEEEDEEEPAMSLTAAVIGLTAITVVVAISAEFLTDAISDVSEKSGLSEAFLGLIILPIAGNACEHITAVLVAYKDKMDLAIGVALGSSIQIAIFVLPVLVLIGWAIGKDFSLDLDPFLILILTLSVIHAHFVSSDGQSNWMMGLQLIGTYVLIALLFGFVSGQVEQGQGSAASRSPSPVA